MPVIREAIVISEAVTCDLHNHNTILLSCHHGLLNVCATDFTLMLALISISGEKGQVGGGGAGAG